MRRLVFSLTVVPLLALAAAPVAGFQQPSATDAALRPLALEDYYRVLSVGSPSISPNGAWVIYSVSQRIEETNDSRSEAWVVATDGAGEPARILHQGEAVGNARWSDDGRIRYSSGGEGWLVDPERPTGPPAPDEPTSAPSGLSPNGRWVATTERLPEAPRPTPQLSDFEQRHEARFEGDAFDWYPFRQDGQRFPLPDRRDRAPVEIFLEAADGSTAPRQLTELGLEAGSLRWTPDGSAIVFTANDGFLDELAYGDSDLFRVTLGGEVTRLTDDGYNYSGLSFSPDGRWMVYERSFSTDMIIEQKLDHGGSQDLYVTPASGGEPVNLTADWDLDPGGTTWSPDGAWLYFTAGIGGATHLFRVAPTGGPVEQVTTGERRINGIDFDASFQRMTYTVGEFDRPSEVYVANIDGSGERRLTDVHAEFLSEVSLATRPTERVLWNSYDGTQIEGFVMFPHGYDPAQGPYPLIVMNHGGPHAASGYGFSFKNSLFAANGYFVFIPNFRSSTGYGDDFKWATWGGWGILDGEDVLSGIDHLIAEHAVDRERVGTTGHSYGGIITNWLITRYPDRFRAAVPGAGESNWTSNFSLSDISRTKETEFFGTPWDPAAQQIMIAQSPYLNCGGVQAATLFVHGEVDYRVPLEGSIQLYTCLKKQRVPAKLIIYEGQSHGISGHWNNVHRMMNELRWWETYLKPDMWPEGG